MTYMSAEERRRTIIDAAVDVIATEGLARATTRRIAERADAPLGTLHYCFRNKDELNLLILERGRATMHSAFDDVDPSTGFEATLRSVVAAYWGWLRDNLGLHLASMELLMWLIRNKEAVTRSVRNTDVWTIANEPFGGDLIRDLLADAAAADDLALSVPVEELTRFMIHRMDGMVFELAETEDEESCERQTILLAESLLHLATASSLATRA